MGASDLTTLQNVKSHLRITDATSDQELSRLITAYSLAFTQEIGYGILRKSYVEIFDGGSDRVKVRSVPSPWFGGAYTGGSYGEFGARGFAIDLMNAPVINDPVVSIDGTVVPKRPDLTSAGWALLDGYRIELQDYEFTRGIGNVTISYDAGQYIPSEPAVVPANPGPYTVQASQEKGTFVSDAGVKYTATGTALTKVTSAPALGQYSVNALGLYTFAAADQGVAVILSYAYLPTDVEQAVIDWVSYRYKASDHIGQRSKGLGGDSVFFQTDAIPPETQAAIDRLRRPPV